MLIGLGLSFTGVAELASRVAAEAPPPEVTGTLADQDLDTGTGVHTVDAAAVFTGTGLSFTLTQPVPGVGIAAATGVVSIDTAATGALDGQPVRVRAVSSGGVAETGFLLTVGAGVDEGYVISITGLTDGAFGPTAEIGSTVTADVPGYTGPVDYQWLADGAAIAGATAASLVVPASADGTLLSAEVEPLGLPRRAADAAPVRYAPPAVAGPLGDVVFSAATGPATVEAGAAFAVPGDPALDGAGFALGSVPAGVGIDAATGVITFDTDQLAPQDETPVAVTATTSGGSATMSFAFSVTDGPAILVAGFDDATDSGSFETNLPGDGTLEAAFVAAGATAPVPAQAGGWSGQTLIATSPPAPLADAVVTLDYGALDGPADLYLYQRTSQGTRSNVVRTGFTADGAAPDLLLVSPAPGATGIAADAPLILEATEAVAAGAGDLRILADGQVVETVAVAAVAIDGDTVTVPHADFPPAAAIEVEWDAGVVRDLSRNPCPAGTGGAGAGFEAEAEPFAAALTAPLRFQDTAAAGRLTSFTFSAVALGAPSPGREIFLAVGVFSNEGPGFRVTGVTVDGTPAAEVAAVHNEVGASVWRLSRPTGTAADVTVTVDAPGAFCLGLAAIRATGHRLVASDIGQGTTATGRLELDTAQGGAAFGVFMIVNGAEPAVTGGMAKAEAVDIRSNEWMTLTQNGATTAGTAVETVATYPAAVRNVAAGLSLEAL